MRRRVRTWLAAVAIAGVGAGVTACESSQRVRQVPGETLPPLPPTVSVRRRATTTSTTVPVTYVVQPGDTLDVIAARLAVELSVLVAFNQIADPDRIEAGQVLLVPPGGSLPPTTAVS